MSLLSSLPAPKQQAFTPSRWEQDDEDLALTAAPAEPERSVIGKEDATKADFWQVVPKGPDVAANPHPDRETVVDTMASTMDALGRVVENKLTAANPKALNANVKPGGPTYIKYTPQQASKHHNSGVDHRIIQMQEMPVDPLEPPKFRHQKVPRVPDQTPIPVLHSPPRPVTKEDQANWKIPPCVSAWKNNKGYTIPLDKRLAADGRGMQEETLNKKHMTFAQALLAAEETSRREVELQARLQKEIKQRQKAKKEEQLRALAAQARMGGAAAAAAPASLASRLDDEDEALPPPPARSGSDYPPPPGPPSAAAADLPGPPGTSAAAGGRPSRPERLSEAEIAEKRKRDELRHERTKEREREFRQEERERASGKKSRLTRDRDRDVSEKMALGQADVSKTREVQYDSRLFNRDAGLNSGFTADESYNFYDKDLFTDRSAMTMYRSRDVRDGDVYGSADAAKEPVATKRFQPDKGFAGTEATGGERSGPVQFDRAAKAPAKEPEADPFGIDSFLGGVSKR